MSAAWPPTLEELKVDLGIDPDDNRRDAQLKQALDAAIAYVERVRPGFRYVETDLELPEPDADMRLGTLRLAGRWHIRRRSPDGVISMDQMGATRVSTGDVDIDRLLRLGRHGLPQLG